MEAQRRSLTDRPRSTPSAHLCLLDNGFCSNTPCEVRNYAQSFLRQPIGAVEELEVAMGSVARVPGKRIARMWNDRV